MAKRPVANAALPASTITSCSLCGEQTAFVTHGLVRPAAVALPAAPQCDVATSVATLITELVYEPPRTVDEARRWLDRLRRAVCATQAVLWTVPDTLNAVSALRASSGDGRDDATVLRLDGRKAAIDRISRMSQIACGVGEVSGVEDFVPRGVLSYIVAGANRRGALASVLVLGWTAPLPLCGPSEAGELRIAAALLDRAVAAASRAPARSVTDDALIGSLSDGIAILDRHGALIASTSLDAKAKGRDAGTRGFPDAVGALDVWRRAAADGAPDAAGVLDGVTAVAGGSSPFFQAACMLRQPPGSRWTIVTARPLRPAGGAVAVHCDLSETTVAELTRRLGDARFVQVLEALPAAVWVAAADGRVTHASRRFEESIDTAAGGAPRPRRWFDAVHPDDRTRVATAFDLAVARGDSLHLDVRLRSADGAYRWFSCAAAPLRVSPSAVDGYVGICIDISAQRRAESAREAIASKLLAAQDAERARVTRDLHDDLGHQVVLLDVALQAAMRQRWSRARSWSTMGAARMKLQEIATSIHLLAHRLHPAKLKLLGLASALQALCRDIATEVGCDIRFEASDVPADIDEGVAVCLFRIVQEALQNAVKHSGAPTILVALAGAGESLRLRVADDGGGFDPLTASSAGLGLLTMRERVELIGGALAVVSAPGRGTAIEVTVNARRRSSNE